MIVIERKTFAVSQQSHRPNRVNQEGECSRLNGEIELENLLMVTDDLDSNSLSLSVSVCPWFRVVALKLKGFFACPPEQRETTKQFIDGWITSAIEMFPSGLLL